MRHLDRWLRVPCALVVTGVAALLWGPRASAAEASGLRVSCKPPSAVIAFEGAAMLPLCDGVYVERDVPMPARDELVRVFTRAVMRIHALFGPLNAPMPLVLFCRTAACKVAFGADPVSARSSDLGFARDSVPTADGSLSRNSVIVTVPGERTENLLMHELVHATMKTWVPYEALPTWFNEGLATAIAGEPVCDPASMSSQVDVTALVTNADWQNHIATPGTTLQTYCQARFATEAWAAFADGRGLAQAARTVANRVAAGEPFR